MTYRALPLQFNKNSYQYKQVWRDEDYAIYSQICDGVIYAFEVYRISKNESGELFGKYFEASESIPSSEQWGKTAYTVADMERAFKRIEDMKARKKEVAS